MSSSNSSDLEQAGGVENDTSLAMMPQTQHHIQMQDDKENVEEGKEETIGNETRICLYRAALKGDWQAAKTILEKNPSAVRVKIGAGDWTVLHIATMAKRTSFVAELVQCMTESELELKDKHGKTACDFAVETGFVEIASLMRERNKNLSSKLRTVALLGHKDMVSYLSFVMASENIRSEDLVAAIHSGMYDVALEMLKKIKNETEIFKHDLLERALPVLARKPLAIPREIQPGILERLFSSGFKRIVHNKDLMRKKATQLVEKLLAELLLLDDRKIAKMIREPLFDAAKIGNVEFVILLIRKYPDIIWEVDYHNRSIFHIAVQYRHESVFNLMYEIGAIKNLLLCHIDDNGRNILHLAAMLAPLSRPDTVIGAAFQMQRELLWFEEVEKIVQPSFIDMKNRMGWTAREMFFMEHRSLVKDGEKWVKDTATSCMLVATLVATVVFAAAFTIPGGNKSETGTPIFLKNKWFMVFAISDAVAMFTSTTSIVLFWSILTASYEEDDFRKSLPIGLMKGLSILSISIGSMLLAFTAAFFLAFQDEMAWVPKLIAIFACGPIILFTIINVKRWSRTIGETYSSRVLFRPGKYKLF